MVFCAAFGCTNRSGRLSVYQKEKPKVSFHLFPRNAKRRNVWIQACRRKFWDPPQRSYLCSEHFAPECFSRTPSSIRLKPDAMPTIFPALPERLQQIQSKRKPSQKRYYKISDNTAAISELQVSETQSSDCLSHLWLTVSEEAATTTADVQKQVDVQEAQIKMEQSEETQLTSPHESENVIWFTVKHEPKECSEESLGTQNLDKHYEHNKNYQNVKEELECWASIDGGLVSDSFAAPNIKKEIISDASEVKFKIKSEILFAEDFEPETEDFENVYTELVEKTDIDINEEGLMDNSNQQFTR